MFRIKRFNEDQDIYHYDWDSHLPESITIIQRGKEATFKKGNIMKNGDMVQVTYDSNIWGFSSTLEFDFYFLKVDKDFKIDIDITLGDAMVSEFSIEKPNKVSVIQYTSWKSKTDTSNTVFALEDKSLKAFVDFLNKFVGFDLRVDDFKFLDKYDNYNPR
jgi:viroplasmin and RNaseH domain-containing protein